MSRENAWIRDLLDLKRTARTGWLRIGMENGESVAAHSLSVGLLAWRLAGERGLDRDRAHRMALLHDFHEARLGDIPSPAKRGIDEAELAAREDEITREQWGDFAPEASALMDELRGAESSEAKLVHLCDKLDLLLQARRYLEMGHPDAQTFIDALEGDEELWDVLTLPWLDGESKRMEKA
jgi:putative hydrolase of HD superfamily